MLKFTGNPLTATLKAGTVTCTAKADTTVLVYVPNKDSVAVELAKDNKLIVTTLSAGESFTYLNQNVDGVLEVSLA